MHGAELVTLPNSFTRRARCGWLRGVGMALISAAVASVAVACHGLSEDSFPGMSAASTGFLVVNGLRLQVFDWGGSGTPLVLIAGGGVSPRMLDDLAARLTDRHHVVSFARRGHGQSEVPDTPFTVDDLVDDMRQVLDSLGITEAIMLAHSFGGNEMTRFAERYPNRVLKLIYLDAAFDWSTPEASAVWLEVPFSDAPTPTDLASVDNFRKYQQRMPWVADVPWSESVEAAFQDRIRVAPDGSVSVPVEQVFSSLLAINQSYRRSYTDLTQPTLALFAEYYIPPSAAWDSASTARQTEWHVERFLPLQQATIDRLAREIPDVRVEKLPGIGHEAVVYTHLDQLAARIGKFTGTPGSGR